MRNHPRKLLISCFSFTVIISIFAVAEVVLRFYYGFPKELVPYPSLKRGRIARYVEKHHWVLIPNSVGFTKEGIEYRINSQGMRSGEVSVNKPMNAKRFLFLGDSIIFGWRVPVESSLPEVFRTIASHENHDYSIETMNCGVIGYSSLQGRLQLSKWLRFFPDYVFINFGWNDSSEVQEDCMTDLEYHLESQYIKYKVGVIFRKFALIDFLNSVKHKRDDKLIKSLPRGGGGGKIRAKESQF